MKLIINILLFQFTGYFTYAQECGQYINSVLLVQMDRTFFDDSSTKMGIIEKICNCSANDIGILANEDFLLLANKLTHSNLPPDKLDIIFYQVQLLYDQNREISYGFMYWKESSVLDRFCDSLIIYSPNFPMLFTWFTYDWKTEELVFK